MTPEAQAMLEKVRKLLNLANDKGATDGERENAMRMAHKLLAKHNLTMAQVEATGQKTEKRILGCMTFYGRPWAQVCAQSIARLFFCEYVVGTAKRAADTRHFFIGKESNAITAAEMARYIVDSIRREARRHMRDSGGGNIHARSFAMGAAAMIAKRVDDMLRESSTQRGDGKSLVLASVYDQEQRENQRFQAEHMKMKKGHARGKDEIEADAHAAGREYGRNVSLHRQVEESTSTARIEHAK